ncbi:MAG: hypothetical protein FWC23_09515 [Chitinispirillia bacterium]|nr:hypothetical protein [Chitinispirillia bacterium]MCL2269406.1 hypothetical protein [Chitinispirillia bacterium]
MGGKKGKKVHFSGHACNQIKLRGADVVFIIKVVNGEVPCRRMPDDCPWRVKLIATDDKNKKWCIIYEERRRNIVTIFPIE